MIQTYYFARPVGVWSIVISLSVCMSVCLFSVCLVVCPLTYLSKKLSYRRETARRNLVNCCRVVRKIAFDDFNRLAVDEWLSELLHVACNFNCLFETEGLLVVKGNHVHCKRDNNYRRPSTDTLFVQITNSKWYMAYRTEAIPMTLSDSQGHSPVANLFKCDFSNS